MSVKVKSAPEEQPRADSNGPPKKRPKEVIRRYVGGATIEIAIFEKEIKKITRNGTFSRMTYFVAVGKSWRKRQEEGYDGPPEYDSGSAFNPHELLVLADAIQAAYHRCNELQDAQGEEDPF